MELQLRLGRPRGQDAHEARVPRERLWILDDGGFRAVEARADGAQVRYRVIMAVREYVWLTSFLLFLAQLFCYFCPIERIGQTGEQPKRSQQNLVSETLTTL